MPEAETELVISDSDWEYEYDHDESEAFYFTLDLPPTIEPAAKRRKANGKKGAVNEASDLALGSKYITNGNASQQACDNEQKREPIRFSGLHTTTPSVQYGSQHYDCRWTTDLGTQFHVSRPGGAKRPHRAGHAVDVVALSRVRLTGRHTSTPTPPKTDSAYGNAAQDAIILDGDEDDDYASEDVSTPATKHADGPPQLSFLERIAEIQRRKAANGVRESNSANASPAISSDQDLQGVSKPSSSNGLASTTALEPQVEEPVNTSARHSEHVEPGLEVSIPLTNGQQSSKVTEAAQSQDKRDAPDATPASADGVT